MSDESTSIDFRATLNPDTGRIDISIVSEQEPKESDALVNGLQKFKNAINGEALRNLLIQSSKTDPESMKASARKGIMWTKSTCDIIT